MLPLLFVSTEVRKDLSRQVFGRRRADGRWPMVSPNADLDRSWSILADPASLSSPAGSPVSHAQDVGRRSAASGAFRVVVSCGHAALLRTECIAGDFIRHLRSDSPSPRQKAAQAFFVSFPSAYAAAFTCQYRNAKRSLPAGLRSSSRRRSRPMPVLPP